MTKRCHDLLNAWYCVTAESSFRNNKFNLKP